MAIKKKGRSVRKKQEKVVENLEERNIFASRVAQLLKKPKVYISLIVIILVTAALYLKGLFIVAIVNGQPITRLAVIRELEKRNGEQTLSSMITETLILQEAQKRNVTVSQKEIEDSVKTIEKDLKKQNQSLDQALAFQGMTKKDFERQLQLKKLVEKMLAKEIEPTDKEINEYIEQNKDSLPKDMKEEEIKQTAKEQLAQQKLSSKVQEWLADLQKKATINYFVNY